ncbi:MAG: TonB-dependent receptor [Paludibacteraceae bacterium]|nr:TonB-dependent receptor [Paludibacteraceae bacterium]
MKKAILTTILLVEIPVALLAGSIQGIVSDESGVLPDADVILYKQSDTTSVFRTDMTTDDGKFVFNDLPNGHYMVKVEYIGFKTKKINVSLTKAKPDIKAMKVNMKDDGELIQGVEVVGQRTALHVDADKKTFLVNAGAVVEGVSISDLLREIPSVDVDVEGNVSLRNNEGVEIYINGKPAGMNDGNAAEILEQLPANSIEKVEVITNPSSKYNAEGSAGIINIVLKEDFRQGYYGSVNGGLNVPIDGKPSGSLGASITYNTQKWMLNAAAGWQGRCNNGTSHRYLERYTADGTYFSDSETENKRKRNSEFLNLGATYRINDNNSVSWTGMASLAQRDNKSETDVDYGTEWDYNTVDGKRTMFNTGLDYNHSFAREGEKLRIAATFNTSSNNNEKGYSTNLLDQFGNSIDSARTYKFENSDTHFNQFSGQADYTLPMGKTSKLEVGAKADVTSNTLETDNMQFKNKGMRLTGMDNSALDDNSQPKNRDNDFEMNQNIYAAYMTFSSAINKRFKYNVGIRGELTDMNWEEHLNGDKNSKSYFDPFPSAFLSYTLSEKDELQFNYTSRLTRPRMRLINPYRNISDSKNLSYGNPDLVPEKTHAFELNYVRNVEGDLYTASVYYKYTKDVISRFTWLDDAQISNSSFFNTGKCQEEGLELIAKNHIGFLTLTSNINLYYYSLNGASVVIDNSKEKLDGESSFSWTGKMSADMQLPWKLSGQITANYNSPRATIQGRRHHMFTMNAGLKRSFMQRKLTASLSVRDLFNTFQFHSTNYGDDFYQDNKFRFMGTTIFLNLSYNFGTIGNKKRGGNNNEGDDVEEYNDFGGE